LKRWLGIDWGKARIGLALSDPLGITAQPLVVLKSDGIHNDIAAIGALVNEYAVTQVVIGLPLNMNGTESTTTEAVQHFAYKLSQRLTIPVVYIDERLSSKQAERTLIEGDVRRENRKGKIDKVAAALLLQSALAGSPLIPLEEP
jgi:putative Holliday junction resolvase